MTPQIEYNGKRIDEKVLREIGDVFNLFRHYSFETVPSKHIPEMLRMLDCFYSIEELASVVNRVNKEFITLNDFYQIVINNEWGGPDMVALNASFKCLDSYKNNLLKRDQFLRALSIIGEPISTSDLKFLANESNLSEEIDYTTFVSL